MNRTQVIVAGAGPTGAVAAWALASAGVDVILVEAHPDAPEDMRASTFHPPTLEMLEALGLREALEAQGLRAPVYQYRNRASGEVLSFDLGEVGDVLRYPYRLQCEQFKLSRLVAGLLERHPHGRVLHGHRVTGVAQDGAGVTVTAETGEGDERGTVQVRADYLIAADGAGSTIRKAVGIPFDGFTYPEKFLTLSTAYPAERHFSDLANVSYMADRLEWCVLLRVPTLWRVLVPAAADDPDEALRSDERRRQVFTGLFGADGGEADTHHRTVYRVHQRVARTFRQDRVLLAGDAAHLNNPLGGLGMNSGIHDVVNLAAKLVRIIGEGEDPDPLLDRYDRQRRTVMNEFVQRQTISNKRAMEAGTAEAQREGQARLAAILADGDARRDYLLQQSMYASLQQERAIA